MTAPRPIDLRSDTVTRPSPAMRRAMADAPVGDDVLDGDPTTRRLEQRVAELVGQDDALFFPSGTQANQTGIALLTRPGTELVVELHGFALLSGLGIERTPDGLRPRPPVAALNGLDFAAKNTGVPMKARGPTRIGARMGRPEKAAPREMSPPPHALFPIGSAGGMQRLVNEAVTKEEVEVEIGLRVCPSCRARWFLPRCPKCGAHTEARMRPMRQKIPLREVLDDAMARVGMAAIPAGVKAVQGMISRSKTPEPLEKGLLRAKHGLHVFKDGTTRFDMTNLVLTHFRPEEIRLSVEQARGLGYTEDVGGRPIEDPKQLIELRPQDVVIPEACRRSTTSRAARA